MENSIKLIVNNIIGEYDKGFSRITINNELFNAVRGMKPQIAFTDMNDAITGERIRLFKIAGNDGELVNLYASYDKETSKTIFIMDTENANKHYIPLAQQLANGPKTPFSISKFDRTIKKAKKSVETTA